ncbi:unnamed protein product [Bursaphelenchus okinawaensis]|uniref:MARVEL domain-containing protein n=1 Tax=Bursaphelenchus okinawaensis TaxID=465554 RepID=A0A811KU45_9BILA|nr:unnamed protein product [Bursaphelenchus okinawaensis]CAG9112339.1 unnamed protein product [Bursaphelenchus okinawaensis]
MVVDCLIELCQPKPSSDSQTPSGSNVPVNPIFQEDDKAYFTCCNLVHVIDLAKSLIFAKIFIYSVLLAGSLSTNIQPLIEFGFFLAFGLALLSYAALFLGMRRKRFHLFIPYFFVSFVLIVIAVVHLFVDFLDSANTRDTMSSERVSSFIMQIGLIVFEVYCLLVVWRVFIYVCDARSVEEVEEKRLIKQKMYDNYEIAF